jgi:hypothetical protein
LGRLGASRILRNLYLAIVRQGAIIPRLFGTTIVQRECHGVRRVAFREVAIETTG